MKSVAIILATVAMLASGPAFAGGKNFASISVGIGSGKGGLVGSLLGAGKSPVASIVTANVATSKKGVIGLLLGSGGGLLGGGGHGCGC